MLPVATSAPRASDANSECAAKDWLLEPLETIVLSLPGSLDPAPCLATARAGGLGILDLTFVTDVAAAVSAAQMLSRAGESGIGLLLHGRCGPFESMVLEAVGACDCILLAPIAGADLGRAIRECGKIAPRVGVIATSISEANEAVTAGSSFIVAKGNEAGGLIGEETTFVLLQHLAGRIRLPLYAWGGIGLHTAAACVEAGARGIVLDWQLALLHDVAAPLTVRRRLEAADGSETLAVSVGGGRAIRFYAQAAAGAKKQITGLAQRIAEEGLSEDQWRHELAALISQRGDAGVLLTGQDLAFAASFRRHCTSIAGALDLVQRNALRQIRGAAREQALQRGGPIANSHGTEFPLVQGPMTRVSDTPEFCEAIAAGGALPFLALALMPGPQVEDLLQRTRVRLGNRPWGVGILGFADRELREAQFRAIEKLRPPFALVAGGRPDHAAALEALGIKTYLHVPSPVMLNAFLKEGCRRYVFEGRECGGHVGPRSSFVLWESMIEALLNAGLSDEDAQQVHILFAGGVHDHLSAAMVAALAQPLVERGMKIGALMGTAYLFTEEVVSSGAVVPEFQEVALAARSTALLESGPGHVIRCADTPFVTFFDQERKRLLYRESDGREASQALESLCLGRLRIASKGIARKPDPSPGESPYANVDQHRQRADGMYMLGQVAALRDKRVTIRQLHEDVCGKAPASSQRIKLLDANSAKPKPQPLEIAVVGMGCILPGAPDMARFWENILARRDCVREVPPDRFDADRWYDADRKARDKVYSKWGGFIEDIAFNPLQYGIPPKAVASIEPAQLLALELVQQALRDAGLGKDNPFRDKTSVILGAGGGLGEMGMNYAFRSMLPRFIENPDETLWQEMPEWTEDSFAGFLLNVLAGRVSSRFDLGGVNYTVDAACASSLAAVYLACRDLSDGSSDVAIAGGVDTMQHPFSFTAFAKTEALSPRGKCRPFDASADGIAISEGLAAVVLKRLQDAERDGDRIYAVLRGVAGGSDGKQTSITAPSKSGQRRTLERAYSQANIRPTECDLFEAHGTGTAVGDVIECETLSALLRADGAPRGSKALGSVKSMIGHTKSAAGVTGLIKAALSIYHGVLPATLHVENPNPKCGFPDSPLHVNTETRPWTKSHGRRAAGVSAFGFGGTNFHAVLQEYDRSLERDPWRTPAKHRPEELFVFQGTTKESLADSLRSLADPLAKAHAAGADIDLADLAYTWQGQQPARAGGVRAAIVAGSAQQLIEGISALLKVLGGEAAGSLPVSVYFTESPLASQGKAAVVFPGQGSQFPNMLRDLAIEFPPVRQVFERADRCLEQVLERPLSHHVFPPPAFTERELAANVAALKSTEVAQPALAAANVAVWKLLQHLGLQIEMFAGHSFGELVALHSAGSINEWTLFELARERGQAMVNAQAQKQDLGQMLAVAADAAAVERALDGMADVWLSNLNSPRQTTISGSSAAIQLAREKLESAGLKTAEIAVSCAFHSPLMIPARDLFAGFLDQATIAAPRADVYANATGEPHPSDPAEIRTRLADHLVAGVRFADQIRAMYRDGARVFVEVGPGNILSKLIGQTLGGQAHLCIATQPPGSSGVTGFVHAIAGLYAQGYDLDLERLYSGRGTQQIAWQRLAETSPAKLPAGTWLVNGAYARPVGQPPRKPVARARLVHKEENEATVLPSNGTPVMKNDRSTPKMNGTPKSSAPPAIVPPSSIANSSQPPAPSSITSEDAFLYGRFQDTMQQFLTVQQRALDVFFQAGLGEPQALSQTPANHSIPAPLLALPAPASQIPLAAPRNGKPQGDHAAASTGISPAVELPVRAASLSKEPPANHSAESLRQRLLAIVSQRTGYPTEALNPDAHLEAELGIDSIKRTEIIAAYREQALAGMARSAEATEQLAAATTINELVVRTLRLLPQESQRPDISSPKSSSEPPPVPSPISSSGLLLKLQEIVAERTGYPVEALHADANLESDLGIDSIKRSEILASFRSQIASAGSALAGSSMEELAAAKSLQEIVHVVLRGSGASSGPNTSSVVQLTEHPAAVRRNGNVADPTTARAPRCVATVVELPAMAADESLVRGKTFLVTDDGNGVAAAVLEDLRSAGAVGILINAGALASREAAAAEIDRLRREVGSIQGLLHLQPLRQVAAFPHLESVEWRSYLDEEVKGLMFLLQALEKELQQGHPRFLVAAASVGGGDFGPDLEPSHPWRGGLAGLLKTASSEWPRSRFCCLNYAEPPSDLLTHLLQEFAAAGPVDVGYLADGTRLGIQLVRREVPEESSVGSGVQLDEKDVVLVLGGARGITAAVAVALAQKVRAHFVLFGRSPVPEPEDPVTRSIEDPLRLRKAVSELCKRRGEEVVPKVIEAHTQRILSGREIQATLAAITATGAGVEYEVCDVRDPDGFARSLRDVQKRCGPVRAIIHGAGVIEDRLLVNKTAASFDRVVGTKLDPILTLVNELDAEQLRLAIFFASVSGFFGNPGQADYATANEIVNRLARRLTSVWNGRIVSLNWGPWSGAGMVTPEVARQFESRKIGLVSVPAGQRAALDELRIEQNGEVRVVIGDGPWLEEAEEFASCLSSDGQTRLILENVRSAIGEFQPSLMGP